MADLSSTNTVQFLSPRNLVALIAGAGIYMGVMLRNPHLLFMGFTAATVLVLAAWRASKLLKTLKVIRSHQPRTFEGESVAITLELVNETRENQSMILVEDSFPPGDIWKVHHLIEKPLKARQKVKLRYSGECNRRRGLYTLGPVRLETHDAMGLFRRELAIEEFTFLLVYPEAVDLSFLEVLADGTLAHVGIESTARAGTSSEFTGVRPYRVGDSPNTIHWRSTARTRQLIVKEFEELMTTEVSLFLDLGRMGLTGLGNQTSMEYAIKAAASIARRATEQSHAVQLFAIGSEIEHTPPGTGARHLLMVLDQLALLKNEGESQFVETVMRHVPLLQRGGTAFVIMSATTVDGERVRLLIDAMLQRRILPVVVLIDDRAFVKLFREQEHLHGAALSLEEIAQRLMLQGARVHLVTKAKSAEQALLQGLDRSILE